MTEQYLYALKVERKGKEPFLQNFFILGNKELAKTYLMKEFAETINKKTYAECVPIFDIWKNWSIVIIGKFYQNGINLQETYNNATLFRFEEIIEVIQAKNRQQHLELGNIYKKDECRKKWEEIQNLKISRTAKTILKIFDAKILETE